MYVMCDGMPLWSAQIKGIGESSKIIEAQKKTFVGGLKNAGLKSVVEAKAPDIGILVLIYRKQLCDIPTAS